jgi:protein-disulfide isomerase
MNEGAMRIMIGILAAAAGAAATVAVSASGSAPVAANDRAAIEKIVREYILANPEILPEAMDNLRARETAKVVKANRKALETPFASAWEGAADADVTIVQFFDYNCGYCRAAMADIEKLIANDKKLRVVYREFPVLGPDSDAAARVSLAAAKAGKYPAFHRAVYAAGRPEPRNVERIAKGLGIDLAFASDPAAQAEIDANLSYARPLGISGTPAWVVGDRVLAGAVGHDALKEAVAAARAK